MCQLKDNNYFINEGHNKDNFFCKHNYAIIKQLQITVICM